MDAPWVEEMRYMAQLDAEEAADYERERLASEIAADPHKLATAIVSRSDANPLAINLARVLTDIYTGGTQATPKQSMALCVAVQAIADDAARYEIEF